MLTEITVKNFAIIEDINVKFNKNMTVLTGQTGAGKSLIIDAIGLVLGARADLDMIRHGFNESVVTAVFTDLGEDVLSVLNNFGIKESNELTITRTISNSSKSSIKVNDTNITLQQLKQIGLFLGDIHVQHDTYRLINKDTYLSFLDDFKNKTFLNVYNDYQLKRVKYFSDLKKYQECLKKNNDLNSKIDFLIFQKEELTALGLEVDLDKKLESEIEKLSNFDKIFSNLNEAYVLLSDDNLKLDNLYEAANNLKKVADFDPLYSENSQNLFDAYYLIDDVVSYLYKAKDQLDFDPNYLDELNSKLHEINKIKEKYKMTNNELIDYLDKITLELDLITNYEEAMATLEANLKKSFDILVQSALKLRDYRMREAKKCEKELVKECIDLDLENTRFEIVFNEVNFNDIYLSNLFLENGVDLVDFNVSFNVGEPLKPLSKVASGGELSRLMLAFKTIYLNKNHLSFMIFDEIDSGVSGLTARKIALKMHEISKKTQVLAITHLPQVACIADTHLYISKEEENKRTKTSVKALTYEEKVTEIAIMISGLELSSSILDTARKMIESFSRG